MKLYVKIVRAVLLAFIALVLLVQPVFAAYSYFANIQVQETGGNNYSYLPIIANIDNDYLADNGYISLTGLDTRVLSGGTELKHMLADGKVLFVAPSVGANSTGNYKYTLNNTSNLSSFPIVTGYSGGYLTISNAAALELGNNFIIEQKGYVNTGYDASISYQGAGAIAYAASGNVTPALPTGWLPSDVWLCFIASLDNVSSTLPAGWTAIDAGTNNGTLLRTTLYWRRAVTGDTAPLVTHAAGSGISAVVVGYRGVTTSASPFNVNQSVFVKTPTSIVNNFGAGMTTTINNCTIVLLSGIGGQTLTNAYTGTPTPTERIDAPNTASYPSLVVADFLLATPGATGSRTSTITSFLNNGYQLSLVPASSDKNLVYKADAFREYVSAEGKISFYVVQPPLINDNYDSSTSLYSGSIIRFGQMFNSLPATQVTQISFFLKKVGSPTDTAYVRVRNVSSDAILGTIGTIDVSTLTTNFAWYDFTSSPITVPTIQDVRFTIEYSGGNSSNYVLAGYQSTDVISGVYTRYISSWVEQAGDATLKVYWTVAATVTGISSGEMIVTTSAGSDTMTLSVTNYTGTHQGNSPQSVSLSGCSVPNNSNTWYLNQNNVMPYMEYYKHTTAVGGTSLKAWYQPISMIVSSNLDDRAGTDVGETGTSEEDATIVWGANPAGISATVGSLISSSQPAISPAGEEEVIDIIPEGSVPSGGGVNTVALQDNPLYPVVELMADYTNFTEEQIWFGGATLILLIGMALAIGKIPNHLLVAGIVGFVLSGFFVAMKIYPWWTLLIFGFFLIGSLVMERKPVI